MAFKTEEQGLNASFMGKKYSLSAIAAEMKTSPAFISSKVRRDVTELLIRVHSAAQGNARSRGLTGKNIGEYAVKAADFAASQLLNDRNFARAFLKNPTQAISMAESFAENSGLGGVGMLKRKFFGDRDFVELFGEKPAAITELVDIALGGTRKAETGMVGINDLARLVSNDRFRQHFAKNHNPVLAAAEEAMKSNGDIGPVIDVYEKGALAGAVPKKTAR